MALTLDGSAERYRALLRVQVRKLQLSPALAKRLDSSDLVQETLLRAHRHRDQFRGGTEAQLLGWLYAILRNVVRDEMAKGRAPTGNAALEQSLDAALASASDHLGKYLAVEASPDELAERKEQLLRAAEAVDRLPDEQRDAVVLRDLEGLPLAEVAARLGKSEKSVAGLLRRGREALRKLLTDES